MVQLAISYSSGEMLSFVFLQRRLETLKRLSHEIEMAVGGMIE
jgi:hypothetical protein